MVDLAAATVQPDFAQQRMRNILDGLALQSTCRPITCPRAGRWHLSGTNRMVDGGFCSLVAE